jgi:hypothetical protein
MTEEFNQMATVIFEPLCIKYNLNIDCSLSRHLLIYNQTFFLDILQDNHGESLYYIFIKSGQMTWIDLAYFFAQYRKFLIIPRDQPPVTHREGVIRGLENCVLTLDKVGEDILRGEIEWTKDPRLRFSPVSEPVHSVVRGLIDRVK